MAGKRRCACCTRDETAAHDEGRLGGPCFDGLGVQRRLTAGVATVAAAAGAVTFDGFGAGGGVRGGGGMRPPPFMAFTILRMKSSDSS